MFKSMLVALALVMPLATMAAEAESKAANPQQNKMAMCNKDAGEKALKGDDRKKFMSECLSSKPSAKKTAQQEKMTACNKDAGSKSLKGDERKKFMSACLKG